MAKTDYQYGYNRVSGMTYLTRKKHNVNKAKSEILHRKHIPASSKHSKESNAVKGGEGILKHTEAQFEKRG